MVPIGSLDALAQMWSEYASEAHLEHLSAFAKDSAVINIRDLTWNIWTHRPRLKCGLNAKTAAFRGSWNSKLRLRRGYQVRIAKVVLTFSIL